MHTFKSINTNMLCKLPVACLSHRVLRKRAIPSHLTFQHHCEKNARFCLISRSVHRNGSTTAQPSVKCRHDKHCDV